MLRARGDTRLHAARRRGSQNDGGVMQKSTRATPGPGFVFRCGGSLTGILIADRIRRR
jgi:hypothetical protein